MPTSDPTTTTRRSGAVETVNIPDPLRPIPTRRNMSQPQPRLAPDEDFDSPPPPPESDPPFSRGPARRPDAPTDPARRPQITLSTTVTHRDRLITITATDMTLDQFCDLLDRKGLKP